MPIFYFIRLRQIIVISNTKLLEKLILFINSRIATSPLSYYNIICACYITIFSDFSLRVLTFEDPIWLRFCSIKLTIKISYNILEFIFIFYTLCTMCMIYSVYIVYTTHVNRIWNIYMDDYENTLIINTFLNYNN